MAEARRRALISLQESDFQANEAQRLVVHHQIERAVDELLWYVAARRDLGDDASLDELNASLDREKRSCVSQGTVETL